MKLGSLFSGAGLGDLGWMMAGFDIRWQVEIDPYCQKILDLRFPESKKYHDIKTIKGEELEPVDIVAGGFPCQPFSVAGNQRGDQDDRNLWPQMLRVVKEVRPTWVVGENVSGIIPIYLDIVLADLEAAGYTARPVVFPAHALGENHRRERIWIVAYARHNVRSDIQESGNDGQTITDDTQRKKRSQQFKRSDSSKRGLENVANTSNAGIEGMCGRQDPADKTLADAGLLGSEINEEQTTRFEQCGENVAYPVGDTKRGAYGADSRGSERGREKQNISKRNKVGSDTGNGCKIIPNSKSTERERPGDTRSGRTGLTDICSWFRQFWSTEPGVGRVVNGCPKRVDRLKALGNGQVVACTAIKKKKIMEFEKLNKK